MSGPGDLSGFRPCNVFLGIGAISVFKFNTGGENRNLFSWDIYKVIKLMVKTQKL